MTYPHGWDGHPPKTDDHCGTCAHFRFSGLMRWCEKHGVEIIRWGKRCCEYVDRYEKRLLADNGVALDYAHRKQSHRISRRGR